MSDVTNKAPEQASSSSSEKSGKTELAQSQPRMVMCHKLGKELPGLPRPPYKNALGQRIFEEVSKEAWDMWLKDSVKYINTYRVDLTSAAGQSFMFEQASVYFGFQEGKLADTAFVPAQAGQPSPESSESGQA